MPALCARTGGPLQKRALAFKSAFLALLRPVVRQLVSRGNSVSKGYALREVVGFRMGVASSGGGILPWASSPLHRLFPEVDVRARRLADLNDNAYRADDGHQRERLFGTPCCRVGRHTISRDASSYLCGDGLRVSKQCAVACLYPIEVKMREFATRYFRIRPEPAARRRLSAL